MTRRAIFQTLAGCFAALRGGAEVFRGRVGGSVPAMKGVQVTPETLAAYPTTIVVTYLADDHEYRADFHRKKFLNSHSYYTSNAVPRTTGYFDANRSQAPMFPARMS